MGGIAGVEDFPRFEGLGLVSTIGSDPDAIGELLTRSPFSSPVCFRLFCSGTGVALAADSVFVAVPGGVFVTLFIDSSLEEGLTFETLASLFDRLACSHANSNVIRLLALCQSFDDIGMILRAAAPAKVFFWVVLGW